MKKFLSILLSLVLIATMFSACSAGSSSDSSKDSDTEEETTQALAPLEFSSEEKMMESVMDCYWIPKDDDATTYQYYFFSKNSDGVYCSTTVMLPNDGYDSLEDMFSDAFDKAISDNALPDCDNYYDFIEYCAGNIDFRTSYFLVPFSTSELENISPENGQADNTHSDDIDSYFQFTFYNDDTMTADVASTDEESDNRQKENYESIRETNPDYKFYKKVSKLDDLEEAYNTAYTKALKAKEENFNSQYSDLPSYTDVRYDPYNYQNADFKLVGSAQLDDYFNYDYRNKERTYFCIKVMPTGKTSYGDYWYIYADRTSFATLYEQLKDGSLSNVTFICRDVYPSSVSSDNMATLTDYMV
jgi:hypothetical protein